MKARLVFVLICCGVLNVVESEECVQRSDILYCEDSNHLPKDISEDVDTIRIGLPMHRGDVEWLKDQLHMRIIVFGQDKCDTICDGLTNVLWIHQCHCQEG